ncbi:2-oxo-4-hydroxy-4-carboxy-5-ureidoimidazoline decarboxylase [Halorientalis pallida]|uniref:2-oxo-4-hydroxy-4-carboxy-5-ureidoimidazoline decarboxylase n=1 Tax=Halorientalis pallida TaxID=2479928 RepID=A0A498KYD2_9EURY|nr:2-oxo-4-hydroxy-4-carboxy-5-ureidoimidazoline decarboxylase [Halorientalis pallida]RXK47952.1 2-oxo-4-hydroxy-4-carboxy-5-ureidoimidazoline decarboxylase [Halorientalis pallida]
MSEYTIDELNDLDETSFVDVLGEVYETSPWVAERSWSDRPFESLEALHESMRNAVEEAPRAKRLELLRAHPDLGDRTEMTDASEAEQASAGLDSLSPDQYETFQRLNETYRERFGFPFIMAVKNESPDAIQAAMEDRIENTEEVEFRTALDQVHRIARLRLEDLLA